MLFLLPYTLRDTTLAQWYLDYVSGFGSCWDLSTRIFSSKSAMSFTKKTFFIFFPSLLYQENVGLKVEWYEGSRWTMFLWWVNLRAHANPPKTMILDFGILTRVHVPFISWISESSLNRFRPTFWIRNPIVKSWKASVYMHQCSLSNKHLLTLLRGANGMALHCVLNEDFGSWLYFFLWEALI